MKYFTCDRATMRNGVAKYYVTSKISENIHETPEGFLVCVGVPIARTGEMVYGEGETPLETGDDGRVIIDREEKEVFRPQTIASFEGKAVTITHPTEFVSPVNWSRLAKGVLQHVRRGEGDQKNDLVADLLITDQIAISLVKNGLREVSCGYEAEYVQTDEGRGMQMNIIGNHLALVEEGRAGSNYAIFDHKGKGDSSMTKLEKLLVKLGITKESAMAKVIDEAMKEEGNKEEKKEESKDAASYDELMKAVKDLSSKIESMGKPKDEAPAKKEEKKEEKAADEEVATSLEDRLKALEAAVSKLLEGKAEAQADDEESDVITDEDESDESEDDDFEESTMTGDEIARIEILAPGLKPGKDSKAEALKKAYGTKDGKRLIDAFTGGKAPTFDSAEKTNTLFIAVSELMKHSRSSDLSKTKQTRDAGDSAPESLSSSITAEKMNEINNKHYNRK